MKKTVGLNNIDIGNLAPLASSWIQLINSLLKFKKIKNQVILPFEKKNI